MADHKDHKTMKAELKRLTKSEGSPWIKHTYQGNTVTYRAAQPDQFFKMLGGIKRHPDLWPLMGFLGVWGGMFAWIVYHSVSKMEVQINRAGEHKSTDWEKAKTYIGHKWNVLGRDGYKSWGRDFKQRNPELDSVMEEITKAKNEKLAEKKKHH